MWPIRTRSRVGAAPSGVVAGSSEVAETKPVAMPVLFLRKVTLELCHITERIEVMLADDASPGWMDGEDLDTKTADELTALPRLLQRLRRLAKACAV
jgi:hypothetical protein